MIDDAPVTRPPLARDGAPASVEDHGDDPRRLPLAARAALAVVVLAAVGVVVAQVFLARTVWAPDEPGAFFDASNAQGPIVVNGVLVVLTAVLAFALPARWRWLGVLPGAAMFVAIVGTSLTLGGHLWPALCAVLTAASCWQLGRWTLVRIRALPALREPAVEVILGAAILGLVVLLIGRIGVLDWWNVGVLVVVLGTWTLGLGALGVDRRRVDAWRGLTDSPIAVASAGIIALTLGWAAVWLSAPDIMYDAVYGKAYLSQLWAETGSIGALTLHPVLNITGLSQVVGVPGEVLGARDVGRWLQFLSLPGIAFVLWRFTGPRNPIGPLFAVVVVLVPHLVWQATTAYDDAILVVAGLGVGLAIWRALEHDAADDGAHASGTALAIGLLAGSAIWFKLHLVVLVVVGVLGWLACSRPARRRAPHRILLVVAGGFITAGPIFVLRWIDTGNPLFPSYNNIFKSKYYPPINESLNFPFWPAGAGSWLKAPYEAIADPLLMAEAAAPGSFGLLVPAAVAVILLGWYQRRRRPGLVLWAAVVLSLVFWWMQFRYLRYAMPTVAVGLLLMQAQLTGVRFGRLATGAALVVVAVLATTSLPSTAALFWNVPDRAMPFAQVAGRWDDEDYLRRAYPEKDALDAFQRLAPPGAVAVGDAFQRTYLRDRDLAPVWEVNRRRELASGQTTVARLRSIDITWALMANSGESWQQAWLADAIDRFGEPVFADRGFTLYRFAERPSAGRPADVCDPSFSDGTACWGPGLDRTPGLSGTESAVRSIPACPGTMVGLRIRTAPGGGPSPVVLDPDGATGASGLTSTLVPPGVTRWVYVTVPVGAANVTISINPGASGSVLSARTTVRGSCSAAPPAR